MQDAPFVREAHELKRISETEMDTVIDNLLWIDNNIGSTINGTNIRDLVCQVEDVQILLKAIAKELEGR